MSEQQYPIQVPPLVLQAKELAVSLGFDLRPEGNRAGSANGPSCCIDEVGALLKTLSASVIEGAIGEIGSGAGVGSAWMASGLRPNVVFRTVETDARLALGVSDLFANAENVRVINEDWQMSFAAEGPYKLVFADGGGVGGNDRNLWSMIAGLVCPGGVMVIDDLTPEALWPDAWKGQPDPKRELAFNSGYFDSVEVNSRPDVSTLIMVRV